MSEHVNAARGALAQVIATRGGRADPEAPFVIEHREALIYMLCEAAELEHAIMCQYLYALFSLKQTADEGLTAHELEAVDRWRKSIAHIATQEMLHLALVQNLLSAVGAAPHLSRPNFPQPAGHYPPGVILTLIPFGEQALQHFMFLERPEGMDLNDAEGLAARERAAPMMREGDIVPRPQDFATVGHLYRSIEEGIKHLSAKYGEPWLFVGPPRAQADRDHFNWPELVQVTDGASAQRAIDKILEQGEGPRGHWRRAHFGQFVEIMDELLQLKKANPTFDPARPVLPATVRPTERDDSTPLIQDPIAANCTDLFNIGYEVLLLILQRYFAHTEETDSQLATLAQTTLGLMFDVIKPLGQLITKLPIGVEHSGRTTGASFELFYESDYLLPHQDAAWALIEERLREASAFAERIRNRAPDDASGRLEPVATALLDLAHSIGSRRRDWGGADHGGEVTVAHRRQDATAARSVPTVQSRVDRLITALTSAVDAHQELALSALFAAVSLETEPSDGRLDEDKLGEVRSWKRGLLTESNRHFGQLLDLAELLVAVNGETHLELPESHFPWVGDGQPWKAFSVNFLREMQAKRAALTKMYEDIKTCISVIPPDALIVDPHPAPHDSDKVGQQAPVVDQTSTIAVIDAVESPPADPKVLQPPSPQRPPDIDLIAEHLSREVATDGSFDPLRPADVRRVRATGGTHEKRAAAEDAGFPIDGLLIDSYHALLAAMGTSVCSGNDPIGTRQRMRETANDLFHRVIRPLAESLTRIPVNPNPRPRSGLRPRPARRKESLPHQLGHLALRGARLRAEVTNPPPQLLEALAGLQSVAAANADDEAEFIDECRQAQAQLQPSIQVGKNGPYLVTNIEELDNWLGERIASPPQMALCRCGQSTSKPFCDGTHAVIEFSGSKDPHRVADRRDRYDGLGITVFDNRGICQHSGFCTDRVPVAFRVDQEPFVAPSGARMDEIIRAVRNCPSGALSFAIDGIEQRKTVDRDGQRKPRIQVTKDGPYRVTGGISLVDDAAQPVGRNEGASLEHYAMCRCGQSQNKPFCSGMHWYVEFRDPVEPEDETPTIFEWAGGLPALLRMTELFYEKYVPQDPLLAPLFANMASDHPERVAKWLAEVFCGPNHYSTEYGGYPRMLSQHMGKCLTEDQRARWVALLMRSARDAGLPNDAEFRSALGSYIEWGSRLAVENSQTNATPPRDMPMPHWDWNTSAGPPGARVSAVSSAAEEALAVDLPAEGDPVSFALHIKPLFRPSDQRSMKFAFDLWSFDDVRAHAGEILERLRAGTMPCDGPWSAEKTDVFQRWVDEGTPQ